MENHSKKHRTNIMQPEKPVEIITITLASKFPKTIQLDRHQQFIKNIHRRNVQNNENVNKYTNEINYQFLVKGCSGTYPPCLKTFSDIFLKCSSPF